MPKKHKYQYEEYVTFHHHQKAYNYYIGDWGLVAANPEVTDATQERDIFKALDIGDVRDFCMTAYRYTPALAQSDDIPPATRGDIKAVRRLIKALHKRCNPFGAVDAPNFFIGDRIRFEHAGFVLFYEARSCHLETTGDQFKILEILGLSYAEARALCSEAYGYPALEGRFPEYKPYDVGAMRRMVTAISDRCDRQARLAVVGEQATTEEQAPEQVPVAQDTSGCEGSVDTALKNGANSVCNVCNGSSDTDGEDTVYVPTTDEEDAIAFKTMWPKHTSDVETLLRASGTDDDEDTVTVAFKAAWEKKKKNTIEAEALRGATVNGGLANEALMALFGVGVTAYHAQRTEHVAPVPTDQLAILIATELNWKTRVITVNDTTLDASAQRQHAVELYDPDNALGGIVLHHPQFTTFDPAHCMESADRLVAVCDPLRYVTALAELLGTGFPLDDKSVCAVIEAPAQLKTRACLQVLQTPAETEVNHGSVGEASPTLHTDLT